MSESPTDVGNFATLSFGRPLIFSISQYSSLRGKIRPENQKIIWRIEQIPVRFEKSPAILKKSPDVHLAPIPSVPGEFFVAALQIFVSA